MNGPDWVEEFPASITVCDARGIILGMNRRALEAYRDQGGPALIGTNLLDCHPEPSRTQVAAMLRTGLRNVYTIEKAGVRKLIEQSPWYRDGQFAGFVEIVLELPATLPHFFRPS
ncbi:MAG: diguanylate cyclase [Candidatus Methylomirabilota bacterium]